MDWWRERRAAQNLLSTPRATTDGNSLFCSGFVSAIFEVSDEGTGEDSCQFDDLHAGKG
jgi:hypothetical protein